MCIFSRLIAAYHVLHRLLLPRHPPCALINFYIQNNFLLQFSYNLLPTIHFPLSLKLVEISGFEPLTSALQGQRSPN